MRVFTAFENGTTITRSLANHVSPTATLIAFVLFLTPIWVSAQTLTPIELPENGVVAAPLLEDEYGNLYSTLVIVKFSELVFDSTRGQVIVSPASHLVSGKQSVGAALEDIDKEYGSFTIRKVVPNAVWGDTLRAHVRTGNPVVISDYSQLFEFWFDTPVPLAQVRSEIELIHEVEYTEEPQIIILDSAPSPFTPNDPLYSDQWYLDTVDAERAWAITKGIGANGPLGIAFADLFPCDLTGLNMHPDLINKLMVFDCAGSDRHGYGVSGMAGAETDNSLFLASLGREINLYGFQGLSSGLPRIIHALGDPGHPSYQNIDIVNNSWGWFSSQPDISSSVRDDIRSLLEMGIVVIASGGNQCSSQNPCPRLRYPAAYYFDDIDDGNGDIIAARVIAVSATRPSDSIVPENNYSPGIDPINNPFIAFIDVAAPGDSVRILRTLPDGTHTTGTSGGTSLATPLVAAQAALILSINPTLRVDEVYEIITRSAEKVDQGNHPDSFFYTDTSTGENLSWNQRSGYGRINAYEALRYTIERFGATIPVGQSAYLYDDVFEMWPNVHLIVNGNIDIQSVDFIPRSLYAQWKGISLRGLGNSILSNVLISGAEVGIVSRGEWVSVRNSQLIDNYAGIIADYRFCHGICSLERSDLSIENVLIESYVKYGLYMRNVDWGMSNSTIRNGGDAIYASNATALRFNYNRIQNNEGDGIRLAANSEMHFGRIGDMIGFRGCNRVTNNQNRQVVALLGSYLNMGEGFDVGGYNVIDGLGSACRVHNSSGSIVEAEYNYWGSTTAPPSSYFCGTHSVDVSPYLISDPGIHCLSVGYRPASSDTPALNVSVDSDVQQASRDWSSDPTELLAQRIQDTRNYLINHLEADDASAQLRFLVGLHRRDIGDATGEWGATYEVLESLKSHLSEGDPRDLTVGIRSVAEGAVVVLLETALASGDVDTADQFVTAYEEVITGADEVLVFALNAISVDEAYGRYETALDRISGLIRYLDDDHAGLATDLAFMAEVIAAKAGIPYEAPQPGPATGGGLDVVSMAEGSDGSLPLEYALHGSYPNPTSGLAMIPLDLPEVAVVHVEIFDILGRRVSILSNGLLPAGRHELSLDGRALAAGTYLIVSRIEADGPTRPLVFRQKLTVLR